MTDASGFRAPPQVWLAFFASIGVAAASLVAFWTVVLPLVLVPLPMHILRRSFNYTNVRNALIALPFGVWATDVVIAGPNGATETVVGTPAVAVALLAGLAVFLVIRSELFRRWAKPVATRPRRMRAKDVKDAQQPVPVRYAVDAAPEDRAYAKSVDRASAGSDISGSTAMTAPTDRWCSDSSPSSTTSTNSIRKFVPSRSSSPILMTRCPASSNAPNGST